MAPLTRQVAEEDGTATAEMAAYYARRARGGASLIITEGVFFSEATNSKGYPRQPGLVNDRHTAAWRRVVEAVHREGAVCLLQLQHAGRLADPADLQQGTQPLSASDTHAPGYVIFTDSWEEKELRGWEADPAFRRYLPARAMTVAELSVVADEFAAAAARALEAGFDGVEVHAANGFLLDQFFNSEVNRRCDAFGGSPTARAGYPMVVCERVRAAVGDAIVTLRLSQDRIDGKDDRYAGGVEEAREIGEALRDAPVDALHWASFDWDDNRDPESDEPLPLVLKRASGKPMIANGRIHEAGVAEQVLGSGAADMVAVGRPLFANPDWPKVVCAGGDQSDWIPFERRWVIRPAL